MIILGIETSCDETAAALVKYQGSKFKILSNIVSSQVNIHKKYGGVVPEVAARNHVKNILPVVNRALFEAKIKPEQIDKIAVTSGPGLITSLLVGTETAKTLSYSWQRPVLAINHLKAHLYANWLENKSIKFPAVALIVSGGHTELILMKSEKNFKKIGQTVDDAAGEAFDKVAQLLNIGYPGGPIVSAEAEKISNLKNQILKIKLPRPMIDSNNYNFSFSGLKTAVLYTVQKMSKKEVAKKIPEICYSFQQAVVDVLVAKTIKAALAYKVKTIMLSGGVAANKLLRKTLNLQATSYKLNFLTPNFRFCTDNATMIAAAGFFEKPTNWQKLKVNPNLEI